MRTLVGAVTVAGMLLLNGCGGGDPIPTLPPTPSATPIFSSEEEALAAAEEAYAAYLEMSNLISSEGGVDPERIAPFVTEERLADELAGFERLQASGLRTSGASTFEFTQLQRLDVDDDGVEVAVYACWNGGGVRVLNPEGLDVTPTDREAELLLEVVLVGDVSGQLLLSSDEVWESGPC
jgi:hypothetical protein